MTYLVTRVTAEAGIPYYTTKGRPSGPVTQVPPGGVRAVPQFCTGVRPREGIESPVDRLVDSRQWTGWLIRLLGCKWT